MSAVLGAVLAGVGLVSAILEIDERLAAKENERIATPRALGCGGPGRDDGESSRAAFVHMPLLLAGPH